MNNKEHIAQESLRFLTDTMNKWGFTHPISSLPFPKEEMKDAIGEYARNAREKSTLSDKELNAIRIYYSYLSNFIADDQVELVNEVNDALEKIGPNNMTEAKEWLSNPINDEKQKKVSDIIAQTVDEREKLRQEFDEITNA